MTTLVTWDYKLQLQKFDLKNYGYNVAHFHMAFDTILSKIKQSGKDIEQLDQIMYLLQAYKMYDNQMFANIIDLIEAHWSTGQLTKLKVLQDKIDSHIQTMLWNNQWKVPKAKKEQTTTLTADSSGSSKSQSSSNDNKSIAKKLKAKHPNWKFKRGDKSTKEIMKGDKTYKWCSSPGHGGLGMWVLHEPHSCTGSTGNMPSSSSTQANMTESSSASKLAKKGPKLTMEKATAHISDLLQNSVTFNDNTSDLVANIVKAMYD